MINKNIRIHDKYQFEIKYGYKFRKNKKYNSYDIDTYFFFPQTLGINKYTYSSVDFYSDIQSYVRLMRPHSTFDNLLNGKQNPFLKLDKSIELIRKNNFSENSIINSEFRLKIIGCAAKSAINDYVTELKASKTVEDFQNLVETFINDITKFISKYRRKKTLIKALSRNDLVTKYSFVDEFLSLIFEKAIYQTLELHRKLSDVKSDSLKTSMLKLVLDERRYRIKKKYPSIPKKDNTNEEVVYRMGVLKKYIDSALFLKTHKSKEGKLLEQVVFCIAAGFAMLFATVITIASQLTFGNFTIPFFAALILSYMFKDRIKESLREYFSFKIQKRLFDHKNNIVMDKKNKIGWCKESVNFVKEKNIDQRVLQIRNRDHITEVEDDFLGEKIILYRKSINIFSQRMWSRFKDIQIFGINDILRFNIFKFLQKMDNPHKYLFTSDENDYEKIPGKRVYHINMLIRYSSKGKFSYDRYRIVLAKDGIKRIEMVSRHKN